MKSRIVDTLESRGFLSAAVIVAAVSVFFNVYQFLVITKLHRVEQKLQLRKSEWACFDRAKRLMAQKDSMVTVFSSEYDSLWGVYREKRAVTVPLSVSTERLLANTKIWQHEAKDVVEEITWINKQLSRETSNNSSVSFIQSLLKNPPMQIVQQMIGLEIRRTRTRQQNLYVWCAVSCNDIECIGGCEDLFDSWSAALEAEKNLLDSLLAPYNGQENNPQ